MVTKPERLALDVLGLEASLGFYVAYLKKLINLSHIFSAFEGIIRATIHSSMGFIKLF